MRDDIAAALALDPERKRALLAELLRKTEQPPRRAEPAPLSFAQRALWLLDRLDAAGTTYNVPLAYRIGGRLDTAAIEHALNDIAQRHDVLRSVVAQTADGPLTVVDATFRLPLAFTELEADTDLAALLAREGAHRFDISAHPPIRALLVRIAATEHVLLVTIHHIAFDGWSLGVFQRELAACYAARIQGAPAALSPLQSGYADYARWQRERATPAVLELGLQYWRAALQDAPPRLEFGPPHVAEAHSSAGESRSCTFDPATRDGLRAVALAGRTTLFSTLLALFYVLLWRYTGQRDIVIGAAYANRQRVADEALIGFFVNTLPLRAKVEGDPPFARFLRDVHAMTLAAFDRAEVPFELIVEDVRPARAAARTPLVNVMFVLQNAPGDALALADLEVQPVAVACGAAKFDLTLQVVESAGRLEASIEYRTSLFDAATVDGMLAAFAALAAGVAADAERRVSRLPLLTAAAQQAQCTLRGAATRPLSGARIETLFESQAARNPERVAVVGRTDRLSYRALNERANALATYLRSAGVAAGAAVGICLERDSLAIVAILAVLKAGGVYVPLDPDYPRERLTFMLADCGVVAVLTRRRFRPQLDGAGARVIALDGDAAWRTCATGDLPRSGGCGDDGAYVMYTSGSTGRPKGVLVAHRGIERLVREPFGLSIGPDDTIAQGSTLSFDASTFEIWGALCNGAGLAIVPKDVLLSPHALAASIASHGTTILFMTTSLFREVVRAAPASFRALRCLVVGGEALDAESVALLLANEPPRAFINGYGPTETTTFATAFAIDTRGPVPSAIPIGRPLAHAEASILDDRLELLPPGACGQLFIGGAGVALGYVNRPELTAAAFIADPFSTGPARLYATGDLARYLPSGDIAFLGRTDAQLKLRGFRIEPGEIESALRSCAGVRDAVVSVREETDGNRRLIGYVSTGAAQRVDLDRLRTALRARLPDYLVPDDLVSLAALPLTAGGKIDRAALPAPAPRLARPLPQAAATSELERQLLRLWETLLPVRPIGIRDRFFDIGGHSLLALRLITEIERTFGARLPPAVLFERPTIAQLAQVLANDAASFNRSPLVTLNPDGSAMPLFFLHGSLNGGGYYCLGLARHLGEHRPLHLLRPHGTDGGPLPPTIEAIAAECLALVTAAQPHGPYLLGGFCSGGLVALELARQLRRRGERITNVVLIDVPYAGRRSNFPNALIRIGRRIARMARRTPPRSEAPTVAAGWKRLSENYRPRRYDGRLTILASVDLSRADRERWARISPDATVESIPGDHLSCVTDFIDATGAAVAAALDS